ncbi:MAG: hypothetical protein V3R93_01195 [Candidatus Hydrothermarchaeaceae archaeon]
MNGKSMGIAGVLVVLALLSISSIGTTQEPSEPRITDAYVDPLKVVPGDTMLVSAEVEDDYGIATVTADMGGIETIELELVDGTIYDGLWQEQWLVHDTEVKDYITTITATNVLGLTATAEVEWSDPIFTNAQFNETWVERNETVRFNVTVTDGDGVDTVIATFRYPNTTEVNKTLLNISSVYYYDLNDTSASGTYNVTYVWANDTLGNANSTTYTNVSFTVNLTRVPTACVDSEGDCTYADINASDAAYEDVYLLTSPFGWINATDWDSDVPAQNKIDSAVLHVQWYTDTGYGAGNIYVDYYNGSEWISCAGPFDENASETDTSCDVSSLSRSQVNDIQVRFRANDTNGPPAAYGFVDYIYMAITHSLVSLPTITFVDPTPNNEIVSTNYVYINVTADKTLSTVLLEWNDTTNETMSGSGTNWYFNETDLSVGNYTFRVWANDSYDGWNVTETRWVYYNDTTPPAPSNAQFNETPVGPNDVVRFNVTVNDITGVDTVIATFRYPNETEVNRKLDNVSNVYYYDWTDTSATGSYNVTAVWANDTYGNANATTYTDVSFTVVEVIDVTLYAVPIQFLSADPGGGSVYAQVDNGYPMNVTIESTTNVPTNLTLKGDVKFTTGAYNFSIGNLTYTNESSGTYTDMTASYPSTPPYADWLDIPAPATDTNRSVYFAISIPAGQEAGDYSATVTVKVEKT